MVTTDISTDLDITNGTHGEIVDIVLDEWKEIVDPDRAIIKLQFPPCYVLIKLNQMKVMPLEGLGEHVIPISPISKTYSSIKWEKAENNEIPTADDTCIAFTDFCGQGQTINQVLIDIGPPPSGGLTAYVALLHGQSCKNIWLL
jgi:hypothetical protein